MSQENVEIVRMFYEAGAHGDLAAMSRLMDSSIEVRDSAEVPDAGVYHGHEGFIASLTRFRNAWGEDQRHEPIEFIDMDDERVVAVVHSVGRGRGSDMPVEATWAQLFTVRNKKIVRLVSFLRKEQALEAAGLRE